MPETFAQALARTNPSGAGLGVGGVAGTNIVAAPAGTTASGQQGGYAVTPGSPTFGSYDSPAPVDHTYDAWGGAAGYNQATGQVDAGLNNIRQSGTDAFGNATSGYQGSAQGAYNSIRDTQTGINNSRNNNELNRLNGIQDILGYVRNGLQQGASRLAANNATESSATGALGRAYQQIGSQKARGVNNGAGLQNAQLDQSQSALQQHIIDTTNDLHRQRDQQVNSIGSTIRQQLAQLDQQAIGLSLPGRIAVDQEKQKIVDAGLAQLQGVDQWFQQQVGTVAPETQDQRIAAVQGLRAAGTALDNPFTQQFDQQQVQGPAIDQLPLFTRNKKVNA